VKKADILKTQLEAYRRQVQDLQLKLTEETKRGDKLEFDVKRLQEKLTVCQQDKEVCIQKSVSRIFSLRKVVNWPVCEVIHSQFGLKLPFCR
jgi:predicted RNase H-like nuclease (RuvC/YqgF family)